MICNSHKKVCLISGALAIYKRNTIEFYANSHQLMKYGYQESMNSQNNGQMLLKMAERRGILFSDYLEKGKEYQLKEASESDQKKEEFGKPT